MYDIIGDIHGCYRELLTLLDRLGYRNVEKGFFHPHDRKLVFLGDLTDRGPESLAVIQLVAPLVEMDQAIYVPGNHCDKLYRYFMGRKVQIKHGLETTVAEYEQLKGKEKAELKQTFIRLYETPTYHRLLDQGQLIVCHAGIDQALIGKQNKETRSFCLYGDVTGETDQSGFPIRRDWAQDYNGKRWIIYGHTPTTQPRIVNRTINIDTGCVFGGRLTALRYPELTFESVPSTLPLQKEKFRF